MTTTDERTLRYIDSDGHILEPPTAMLDFAPAEYRDRIWHLETDADGVEYSVWNGRRMPSTGLAGTAGFSDEDVDRVRNGELNYSQTRPSGWTASLRLADMDTDGIDVSVLYPTTMLGLQSMTDVEFGRVQARVYNDWCAAHLEEGEGRLYGAGALPPIHHPDDVQGVVDEIQHVAELPGMVSVFMRPNPAIEWRYFNDAVYDPIWSALQDTELPVAFHPFLAPDLPGACDGSEARAGCTRTAATSRSTSSRRPRRRRAACHAPEHLLHPGDRQPRRRDERASATSPPAASRSGSRAPSSCSSRRTAAGSCRGSSGSTTTPRSSAGTCRG